MSCAGCDPVDCPQDAWHLHVTVKPPKEWGFVDIQRALEQDITRIGMRPIVITNHFRDNKRPPYKELIPTKHVRGTEAEATRTIFNMGVQLNNSGWRVRRLKIEGDARTITPGRALYYECHLKEPFDEYCKPISTNAKGEKILTIRRKTMEEMHNTYGWQSHVAYGYPFRIEACVLDTAPELDHEWINQ